MGIKKYKVNGKNFDFVCRSFWTRNGFAHECELYENDRLLNTAKINYINRTWENYEFQSCMLKNISNEITEITENLLARFKSENNIIRLTKQKKAEFEKSELYAKNKELKTLLKLQKLVRGNVW